MKLFNCNDKFRLDDTSYPELRLTKLFSSPLHPLVLRYTEIRHIETFDFNET
ncbi:hypothetical protein [Paraglaciecola sp. L3A3]|uniref:hypothetical protein n=1 Tax=Paraglaciecola sp. L3A3 TaxID=2686358 RepID=UPI00131D0268|nr:hypothetical protein [Paraglaciecola sp. L3A3]